jgi:hypothetical protein
MKKKRRDPFEPNAYFRSIDDPAYSTREWEYFIDHIKQKRQRFPEPSPLGLDDPIVLAAFYRAQSASRKLNVSKPSP